jgi:phage-related protein
MKQVIWMGSSKEDLKAFPEEARREVGYQLEHVQEGVDPDDWKPMSTVGAGVREIRVRESSGTSAAFTWRRGRREFMFCTVSKRGRRGQVGKIGLGADAI